VLDRQLEVATTYVGGVAAWARAGAAAWSGGTAPMRGPS